MHYILVLVLLLTSCNSVLSPITTVPALAIGVYDSTQKREKWEKYADQGDVYAMYELGNSYCCSATHGQRDYIKSLQWYCKAAEKGYAKAQLKLGKLYEATETLGNLPIAKDDARAYMWYTLASRRANNEAMDRKRALKKHMPPEKLEDGKYLTSIRKEVPCDHRPLVWNE